MGTKCTAELVELDTGLATCGRQPRERWCGHHRHVYKLWRMGLDYSLDSSCWRPDNGASDQGAPIQT